jgi:hypothetical protein
VRTRPVLCMSEPFVLCTGFGSATALTSGQSTVSTLAIVQIGNTFCNDNRKDSFQGKIVLFLLS